VKAAELAYNTIRAAIAEGVHAPGARITEQEVAASAGVSRTPVREAMNRLSAEGLLRFVPNQGTYVNDWSEQDAEDIFELRALLEGYASRLAAKKASGAEIKKLLNLAEKQYREAVERRPGYLERVADLNTRFHKKLQDVADSERLKATLADLTNAPLVLQTFRDYENEDLVRSAHHHLEIVEAIRAGDGEWASSVMHAHVMSARTMFRAKHRKPG
jgi:DNA-binding GntR family transcriptional regulator